MIAMADSKNWEAAARGSKLDEMYAEIFNIVTEFYRVSL